MNIKNKGVKRFGFILLAAILLALLAVFIFNWIKEIPTVNESEIIWSYDISKMPINGTIYHAKMLDNGNIIYAVGRGTTSNSAGIAEINPNTNQIVFSWHNDSWYPGDGPESVYKYPNGNYLFCDGDGGPYCYEMYPNKSIVWSYNSGVGTIVRPVIINGEDDIIILDHKTVKIIRRSDRSTIWEESTFTYVDDADYRVIDGKQTLVISDYMGHNIKRINYTTHQVEWIYKAGSLIDSIKGSISGPFQLDFFDDDNIIVAMGLPSHKITIINMTTNEIRSISPKFAYNLAAQKLMNNTHTLTADRYILQVIKFKIK